MSDDKHELVVSDGPPPIVLGRIRHIPTIEVMETELDGLDSSMGEEGQALGFFTAAAGACVSLVGSWIGASSPSPVAVAIYAACTSVAAVTSLWFGITWRRKRKQRRRLVDTLRARVRPVDLRDVTPAPPA